jgi:hypothetical protein
MSAEESACDFVPNLAGGEGTLPGLSSKIYPTENSVEASS